jgi:hypothetical protein
MLTALGWVLYGPMDSVKVSLTGDAAVMRLNSSVLTVKQTPVVKVPQGESGLADAASNHVAVTVIEPSLSSDARCAVSNNSAGVKLDLGVFNLKSTTPDVKVQVRKLCLPPVWIRPMLRLLHRGLWLGL